MPILYHDFASRTHAGSALWSDAWIDLVTLSLVRLYSADSSLGDDDGDSWDMAQSILLGSEAHVCDVPINFAGVCALQNS